jgi:hypothetical protein
MHWIHTVLSIIYVYVLIKMNKFRQFHDLQYQCQYLFHAILLISVNMTWYLWKEYYYLAFEQVYLFRDWCILDFCHIFHKFKLYLLLILVLYNLVLSHHKSQSILSYIYYLLSLFHQFLHFLTWKICNSTHRHQISSIIIRWFYCRITKISGTAKIANYKFTSLRNIKYITWP